MQPVSEKSKSAVKRKLEKSESEADQPIKSPKISIKLEKANQGFKNEIENKNKIFE